MAIGLELVIPALAGLVTGVAATAYKSRKDLEVQYDIKLREELIQAYKRLWKQIDRLDRFTYNAASEKALTYGDARNLATELRRWYFEDGGLLLSERTRDAYFDLQRALKAVGETGADDHTKLPNDPTGDALKRLGSRLRTSTTGDVATRVSPLLAHSLRAWLARVGRAWLTGPGRRNALVRVTRAWRFDPDAASGWRVRVVNRSPSRALSVTSVWLDASDKPTAEPLDPSPKLPTTLSPREEWQGFVPDRDGLMKDVHDPYRAGRAKGPGWRARSRSERDPPA